MWASLKDPGVKGRGGGAGFLWVFYSSVMPLVWALLCMTKLEIVPVWFYTGPDLGFTPNSCHLQATSNGKEKAFDDSDPKSLKWSSSSALEPLKGHFATVGRSLKREKQPLTEIWLGLGHGPDPQAPTRKVWWQKWILLSWGSQIFSY